MTDRLPPDPPAREGDSLRPAGEALAAPSADPSEEPAYPWDEPLPADGPDDPEGGPRRRHDAFTEARKCIYLKALVKTGCIIDACRLVGPSPRTVYRHQESNPRFAEHCRIALRMCAAPVELTAWQRAVEGVVEEVAVGGRMVTRRRYDHNLLRLLLQGSNPKKYGPRPGFKRKRLLRYERKRMELEIRAEIAETPECSFEEGVLELDKKLQALGVRREAEKLAQGWTKSPDGHWIPPGYGPIPGWIAPPAAAGGEAPPAIPCDSRATCAACDTEPAAPAAGADRDGGL